MRQRNYDLARRNRAGNVTALVAVTLIALVGVVGLVIDGGRAMADRRQAQNGADSSAMAAAIDLSQGKSVETAKATALSYASDNGYSNNGTTNTVTVNVPPTSGAYSGNSKYVEVIVMRKVPTTFMKVYRPSDVEVRSRAVAGYSTSSSSSSSSGKSKSSSSGSSSKSSSSGSSSKSSSSSGSSSSSKSKKSSSSSSKSKSGSSGSSSSSSSTNTNILLVE